MKKYLLVLSGMGLGGAERQAVNFAKFLKKNGRCVTVLGLGDFGKVCEICDKESIPWVTLPNANRVMFNALRCINLFTSRICKKEIWTYGICLMYELAKFIKNRKFDVCISYCTFANVILGYSKKFYNGGIYVWFQRDAGIFDTIYGYQEKAIKQMDLVFANAKSGQDWILNHYGLKAQLIYNGVELMTARKKIDAWRKELDVSASDIVCTMVANLSCAKDHMFLLKTWKRIYEKNSDKNLILVFAGRFDDQYNALFEFAAKNEMLGYVRFLGQVDDITGLLQATSICVFGAKSEGSPNGIIEPAMLGLPIIATDLPEIREIVSEDNYKYLFSRGDIEMAANMVVELSKNRRLQRDLGHMNKEKTMKKFSMEDNFSKLISIVEGEM